MKTFPKIEEYYFPIKTDEKPHISPHVRSLPLQPYNIVCIRFDTGKTWCQPPADNIVWQ